MYTDRATLSPMPDAARVITKCYDLEIMHKVHLEKLALLLLERQKIT